MNETHLEHKTTAFKVPYRITKTMILLHKLLLWLNGQTRKPIYVGYIPVGIYRDYSPADEVSIRKPVILKERNRSCY